MAALWRGLGAGSLSVARWMAQAGPAAGLSASCAAGSRPLGAACIRVQWRGFAQAATESASSERGAGEASSSFPPAPGPLSPLTRRSGVIAIKAGMTQEWDSWGVRVPLTVLWIDNCQVVQVKSDEREGYTALQLGCGSKRPKQLTSAVRGHCQAAGVPLKRRLEEFRVTADALLPAGTALGAGWFVPGQYVDVSGTTIGKGFQGGMKRWGFSGQPASHGNSLAHRSMGSTGQNQDPGRVWKGKKMPGHMGNQRRTVQNLQVFCVDAERNLVYVVGQVPGHRGNFVRLSDAVKKAFEEQPQRPMHPLDAARGVSVRQSQGKDPYEVAE
ncbi:ribosomal protein L3 [Helicosporidium sp. ATCC 50920]|nr:ribosomal protein L3 [Helicosporidium sp. ATCC 50920]|eukprot:KDD73072.1 ribosomal protein L3 [Helicosporidium sp. ATCC 50920]